MYGLGFRRRGSAIVEKTFYENYVVRCSASYAEDRLRKVLSWVPRGAAEGLDVGCGLGRNMKLLRDHQPDLQMVGLDVAEAAVLAARDEGFTSLCADASNEIPFSDASFDFILCGEVLEHVVRTDNLLRELKRVLRPGGTLVLTTPNIAYFPNRLLLLFGIQPLFTETSEDINLGRRFAILGQGRSTQGHLKVFTLSALKELLSLTGWRVFRRRRLPFLSVGRAFCDRPRFDIAPFFRSRFRYKSFLG